MVEMAYRSRKACWLGLGAVAIVPRIIDYLAAVRCRNHPGNPAKLVAAKWELNSSQKTNRQGWYWLLAWQSGVGFNQLKGYWKCPLGLWRLHYWVVARCFELGQHWDCCTNQSRNYRLAELKALLDRRLCWSHSCWWSPSSQYCYQFLFLLVPCYYWCQVYREFCNRNSTLYLHRRPSSSCRHCPKA